MASNPSLSIKTQFGKDIIIDDCFLEYINFISNLLKIDINYENFSNMNHEDRIEYIRNFKLNQILD